MTDMIEINGTPTAGSMPLIDVLVYGGTWQQGANGSVNLTYSFQSGRDPFTFSDGAPVSGLISGRTWTSTEQQAFTKAFAAWSAVTNVKFTKQADPNGADLWYWKGGNSGFDDDVLAWHHLPTGGFSPPAYGVFNEEGFSWEPKALQPSGHAFMIILHELGHGLGLSHPHRDEIGEESFPGVGSNAESTGTYGLNQGIFSVMSYNDGWRSKFPGHKDINYGNALTPMALDIAAMQAIYGTKSNKTGSDTYVLAKANGPGTGWSCIWDTNGTDRISAGKTSLAATIDLREAPLVGSNAGGYVSWHTGIVGGFTIANGVVIENASGGNGNDRITGNGIANVIYGNDGRDTLIGNQGDDRLIGGDDNDTLSGGSGIDTAYYTQSRTAITARLESGYIKGIGYDKVSSIENVYSGSGNDSLVGNSAVNRLESGSGNDTLDGRSGADRMAGGNGNDRYYIDNSGDRAVEYASQGYDKVYATRTVTVEMVGSNIEEIRLTGTATANLMGNNLANRLAGNSGSNTIDGGLGSDIITGGSGADTFVFSSALGSSNIDTIADFSAADDTLYLNQTVFADIGAGTLNAAALVIGPTALDADDRIVFDNNTGMLRYDPDGTGATQAIAFSKLTLTGTLTEADFVVI
jgi:serralysin